MRGGKPNGTGLTKSTTGRGRKRTLVKKVASETGREKRAAAEGSA